MHRWRPAVTDDIVKRLRSEMHYRPDSAVIAAAADLIEAQQAEIARLRALVDAVDAQVAAYMNESIGSSQAIQTISRLLDPEEARRG